MCSSDLLESSYMTEDADGIPVPKTPGAALMALETYLRRQQIMSIKAVEEALTNKAPTERAQENRGRRDHEPAALAALAPRQPRQPQPGEDLRNVITQRTVDRSRTQRMVSTPNTDDRDDSDFEPRGAACFSFNIRDTRMPKGFKLTEIGRASCRERVFRAV